MALLSSIYVFVDKDRNGLIIQLALTVSSMRMIVSTPRSVRLVSQSGLHAEGSLFHDFPDAA